jgi:hypothetical protein
MIRRYPKNGVIGNYAPELAANRTFGKLSRPRSVTPTAIRRKMLFRVVAGASSQDQTGAIRLNDDLAEGAIANLVGGLISNTVEGA